MSASSGSIARLSIPAFRAGDPGSNPGRSTNNNWVLHWAQEIEKAMRRRDATLTSSLF